MTTTIIIAICVLLLLAYVFDLTSSKTRIPSVILLLALGWGARQIVNYGNLQVPDLNPILPILGTIGLILIVLEGALELELDKTKMPLIRRSFIVALLPMLVLAFVLAALFQYFGGGSYQLNLANAIPLCVISSAIAIPTVKNQASQVKEFVIYESSLSDILGVLFFNFIALNEVVNSTSVVHFVVQILLISLVAFIATLGLAWLLGKIDHPIKFAPIILLVILIYAVSKIYHLPGLIFILIFGLFLGNLDELSHIKWINKFKPEALDKEVHRFKEITTEATFLIRALFFLLFGFLIETAELLNLQTIAWAAGIVGGIFILRAIQLKLAKLPLQPYLFIAPRGLITILLFLSLAAEQQIALVNKSLIIQVIILSALLMMGGLMGKTPDVEEKKM